MLEGVFVGDFSTCDRMLLLLLLLEKLGDFRAGVITTRLANSNGR